MLNMVLPKHTWRNHLINVNSDSLERELRRVKGSKSYSQFLTE